MADDDNNYVNIKDDSFLISKMCFRCKSAYESVNNNNISIRYIGELCNECNRLAMWLVKKEKKEYDELSWWGKLLY